MQTQSTIASSLEKSLQAQKIIETHGSIVFLTEDKAYKLKKPVKFSYMDYSTIELREKFCKREIILNSQTAPQIYERAIPIVRSINGSLAIGEEGQIVDWLVEMKRFSDEALLDYVVDQKGISIELGKQLAEHIAYFHQKSLTIYEKDGLDIILHIISINAKGIDLLSSQENISVKWDQQLAKDQLSYADKLAFLLQERGRKGYIRRCHGDLNLHNICIWEGQPVLFDCVEFNNDFTDIDILYDLAFLLMDLDSCGNESARNSILKFYLQYINDSDGIELLPLFCSIRAMVKAHTAIATACLKKKHISQKAQLLAARKYLDLAKKYLIGWVST